MKLISESYKVLNEQLHHTGEYGVNGWRHESMVVTLYFFYGATSILDYGAGEGTLKRKIKSISENIKIENYDPCIPEYSALPEPADVLVATDVMEHIEPEYLDNVLKHIQSLTNKAAYLVIATKPDGSKLLPDGSNPHRIVENRFWWRDKLKQYFNIVKDEATPKKATFVLEPKK